MHSWPYTECTDPYCRLAVANDVRLWEGRNAIRIFNPNILYFNYGSSVCAGFDTTPVTLTAGWLARLLLLPSSQHMCTALTVAVTSGCDVNNHVQGEQGCECNEEGWRRNQKRFVVMLVFIIPCWLIQYRGADKSIARPTSRILFDGENISFDASLVMCINSTNIPPVMIINRIYEHQNLLSL
jgi:hypothetical protein